MPDLFFRSCSKLFSEYSKSQYHFREKVDWAFFSLSRGKKDEEERLIRFYVFRKFRKIWDQEKEGEGNEIFETRKWNELFWEKSALLKMPSSVGREKDISDSSLEDFRQKISHENCTFANLVWQILFTFEDSGLLQQLIRETRKCF